ncbi:MAG TPA: TIGR03016 family PEP-CTERM system-associated outer membrane protein [Acetobacteraceae bacterium]
MAAGNASYCRGWPAMAASLLCFLASARAGLAQTTTELPGPLGFPGNGAAANPFPGTLGAPQQPPNFKYQTNLGPGAGVVPAPGFLVVPRISAFEEFNDNIFQTQNDRRYDFITLLSPGVAISGDTPRLNLKLNYNPIVRLYARTPSQDSVGQQLLAVGDAILVPDTLFLKARAFADDVPTRGGFAGLNFGAPTLANPGFGGAASTLSKNNLTQTESAQLFPYVLRHFGDTGTGKFGINLTQSYSSQTSGSLLNSPNGPGARIFTGEAIAQFLSGPQFGRVVDLATLDAASSTGTGIQNGANRSIAENRIGYVLTRQVLVFGEFGVEHIDFPHSQPPVLINDGVWGIGTTLTPNSDSQVILEYGHHDGITSFQGLARYSVSARTVLTAKYTSGLTTDLQQIESELSQTDVNPEGNPINLETGAPISIVNSLLGINDNLFRTHQLVATATTLLDRDTISLSLQHENREAVATGPGQTTPAVGDVSTTGTATWRHEVSDRTLLTSSVSYGTRTLGNGSNQDEQFFGVSAILRYQFSDKLTGSVAYHFLDRHSNVPGVSMYNDVLLVGLTRTF